MRILRHPLFIGALLSLLLAGGTALWRARRLPVPLQNLMDKLEGKALDMRFQVRGPRPVDERIAIVAFDDKAMDEQPELMGRRRGWARVFEALKQVEPEVVGVDALFAEPERFFAPDLTEALDAYMAKPPQAPGPAHALLERIHGETKGDAHLARAIRELGSVVLGLHLGKGSPTPGKDPALSKGKVGQSIPGDHPPPAASRIMASLPEFNAAAAALGVVTAQEDDSGSLRELIMARAFGRGVFLPMSVQLVARQRGLRKGRLAYLGVGARPELRLGKQKLELEPGARMLLNWRGPAGHYPTYSVADLVAGRLDPKRLEHRIVLLGVTFFGHDRTATALSDNFPGIEVHATAVDNLLAGDPLRRPGWLVDALLVLVLGFFVSLIFHPFWGLAPAWRLLAVLLLCGGLAGLVQVLFSNQQLWVASIPALLTAVLVSLACLAAAYLSEGLARRRLRTTFAHYLADDVIDVLLDKPQALKLGGERRELTVLFSDIRGFTSVSEGLDPEVLSDLLNEYLTPMTAVVLAHRGMLDKYMGDAIMAVFGAPLAFPEHPHAACRAALAMLGELETLHGSWEERGLPPLNIGIGVNTGNMSVGNMGSAERFDYTVLGDQVNLGSRLEGLNKTFGTRIIVSESTRQAVGRSFYFRELDWVAVKGKQEPVRIFELLGEGAPDEDTVAFAKRFETALALYRQRDWPQAEKAFSSLHAEKQDLASALFAERCRGPVPGSDWDGIYRMLSK